MTLKCEAYPRPFMHLTRGMHKRVEGREDNGEFSKREFERSYL